MCGRRLSRRNSLLSAFAIRARKKAQAKCSTVQPLEARRQRAATAGRSRIDEFVNRFASCGVTTGLEQDRIVAALVLCGGRLAQKTERLAKFRGPTAANKQPPDKGNGHLES